MKKGLLFTILILVLTSCNTNVLNENSIEQPQQEVSSGVSVASTPKSYETEEQKEAETISSEEESNTPNTAERKNDPDDWLWEGAVYCEPDVDYQKDLRHPLIVDVPVLHIVASEFMSLDREAFADNTRI